MPNTPKENQRAQQAFALVFTKYGSYLNGQKVAIFHKLSVGDAEVIFKFMEEEQFLINYQMTSKVAKGCQINAFTDHLNKAVGANPMPVIYVNRAKATPTTLVHELLHFFTHDNFRNQVHAAMNEAATEYFTRKLVLVAHVKETSGDMKVKQFADFDEDRSLIYPKEHSDLVRARNFGQMDPRWKKKSGVLKRAYFQGDIAAINLLKEAFQVMGYQ